VLNWHARNWLAVFCAKLNQTALGVENVAHQKLTEIKQHCSHLLLSAVLRRGDNHLHEGMKVRRYNWHSAGSLGWPFPMLKY